MTDRGLRAPDPASCAADVSFREQGVERDQQVQVDRSEIHHENGLDSSNLLDESCPRRDECRMHGRSSIVPPEMKNLQERFRYSPGVRVGNLLFVADQVGRDEELNVVEGKEAQFIQAFENVKKVLATAGATMDDVVDMVSYHTDLRDLALFIQVRDRYVTNAECYPAWTAL